MKPLTSVQTILLISFLLGSYCNISSNKYISLIAKSFCMTLIIFFSTCLICITLINFNPAIFGIGLILCLQYFFNGLLNVAVKEVFFNRFLNKLKQIDRAIGHHNVKNKVPLSVCACSFIILGKSITWTYTIYSLYAFYVARLLVQNILFNIIDIANSLFAMTSMMLFELLYQRMKLLRKFFKRDLAAARRFADGEQVLIQNLKRCMLIYKDLLDSLDETGSPMKIQILTAIANNFPKLMLMVFQVLNGLFIGSSLMEVVYGSLVIILSAVTNELIYRQVDQIKFIVIRQLLIYKDRKVRDAVRNAITFFDQRPYKYTMVRVITLDLSFVLTTIGLVTSYIISMIQFSHIYD